MLESNGLNKFSTLVAFLLVGFTAMVLCSREEIHASGTKPSVVEVDPCTLVALTEAERIIGEPLQPGKLDTTLPHLASCVWSGAKGPPKLILQHWPQVEGSLASWLGAGEESKVVPPEGLSGEAIAVIQKGGLEYHIQPGLSLVAVRSKEAVISLSAPFLEAAEGSELYSRIIAIADTAAQRLTEQ